MTFLKLLKCNFNQSLFYLLIFSTLLVFICTEYMGYPFIELHEIRTEGMSLFGKQNCHTNLTEKTIMLQQ